MEPLRREEAADRSRLLRVRRYDVALDLTRGDERFGSETRIAFDCTELGAATFLDLIAERVESVVLNGEALDMSCIGAARVTLEGLRASNELVLTADMAYSHLGEGMHRYLDPVDGEAYTWTESVVNNSRRVFGCFDQPDLKAPLKLSVRAPDGWTVLSTGAGRRADDGTWTFEETPPLSTYLMVVVAGPYHSVYRDHDGIPLGLHVRGSLAEHLDADELFEVTSRSFDEYHRAFGVRYPFGKYDQVFCPEYELGAMENPGCVKFDDKMIYRSRVTDDERALRATVIAHEMAHMWFGDLVTMRWWDDLWLNESFAEYMGTRTTVEATRFTAQWAWFCARVKAWGYRQDELPSTHPIAAAAPDTEAALLNLDGISYAKGAGVLKQLVAWVGYDAFLAGLRAYFAKHAFGSTDLADLLAALEPASGRDLGAWSQQWLETAGVNVLRVEAITDGGHYASAAVLQTAPEDHPTLRSHRIAIGLYDRDGERLVRRERLEVDIDGARTEVAALAGARVADLMLLNDDDLTWAKIRLDERSLAAVRDGGLSGIDDALARALIWASAWDMTRDAELPVGEYLQLVLGGIGAESDIALVEDALKRARTAIDVLGRGDARTERLDALAATCLELSTAADPGSDHQLAFARAHAGAALSKADASRLRGWLDGYEVPSGLAMDDEMRWLVVRRLAVIGEVDEAIVAAEEARDPTSNGAQHAAAARTSFPTAEAKATAWAAITAADMPPIGILRPTTENFWHAEQLDLCAPYVDRILGALPEMWRTLPPEAAWGVTQAMFPALLVSQDTIDRVSATLDGELEDALRRLLVEGRAELERAMRTRMIDR